ncbi:uncharacterized protein LOC18443404 [Amborella trichopoda]|uniref:Avr9/Cf-9 rapidly elicited protein 146 n=1 Tax=Amborella trichopoda TaxID=13333 RepID=U5D456_AMBTC|nr:uncharacterized protein LOC18443404 [Amborella trichopoda]ERN15123.1 hypothetical protein AMTR_s00056p00099370 [Amborella trichopoda]|eukprot:XP_006853656.1 uncharacterized protein LOC18443404 [Amborella trichopoda]
MEDRPPAMAKRLWKIVRIVLFMLRKGVSKPKLLLDLNLMFERGKLAGKAAGKATGKALGHLVFSRHHTPYFTCGPHLHRHVSVPLPRDYEFSCRNTPAPKRKSHRHVSFPCIYTRVSDDDVPVTALQLQKALELLNSEFPGKETPGNDFSGALKRSPLIALTAPFSPFPLRVTDSPFPLMDGDDDCHVDREAEEFIRRFYEGLRTQAGKRDGK